MTTSIIVPLAAGTLTFLILVAVWYPVAVPAKRKALAKEAHEKAEKETEVMKQKKLLNIIGFCIGLNVGDLFLFGIVRPNMDFLISTLLVTNIVMLVAFVYYTYLSRKKEQK